MRDVFRRPTVEIKIVGQSVEDDIPDVLRSNVGWNCRFWTMTRVVRMSI